MESSSSENNVCSSYEDNYTPSEIGEELYNELFGDIFHLENIDKDSHGWKRVREAIEPKIERQRAFSDYDKEVDMTEFIFRSIDLDLSSLNQENNDDSKEENIISEIDISGNNSQ
jgi:hypothetical protein